MGAIIFLGVCLQTCYIFVVDPLTKVCRDESMGMERENGSLEMLYIIEKILYLIDYLVKLLFFWWSVSQHIFSYVEIHHYNMCFCT